MQGPNKLVKLQAPRVTALVDGRNFTSAPVGLRAGSPTVAIALQPSGRIHRVWASWPVVCFVRDRRRRSSIRFVNENVFVVNHRKKSHLGTADVKDAKIANVADALLVRLISREFAVLISNPVRISPKMTDDTFPEELCLFYGVNQAKNDIINSTACGNNESLHCIPFH